MFNLRPLVAKGLSAAVYTQTSDCEIEVNGLDDVRSGRDQVRRREVGRGASAGSRYRRRR